MTLLLLAAAVKSVAVLAVAAFAALCLRRASAAARHLVWLAAFVGILMLPLLSQALPGWKIATKAAFMSAPYPAHSRHLSPASQEKGQTERFLPSPAKRGRVGEAGEGADSADASNITSIPRTFPTHRFPTLRPQSVALAAYLIGLILVLLRWIVGLARIRRVGTEFCLPLADELARAVGITRPVCIRLAPDAAPVTWGVVCPVILLPADAPRWPDERLRVVLLHELAHVRRGDWLAQTLAAFACAVYWFLPPVWLAARQLRLESERACDDVVLSVGVPAPDYARHLLEVLRAMKPVKTLAPAALPMASPSTLETRLRAILSVRANRRGATRPAVLLAMLLAACVVVPLAGLKLAAVAQQVEKPKTLNRMDFRPKGPVKSDRLEFASRVLKNGKWVESPRSFQQLTEYSPDEKQTRWVLHGTKEAGERVTSFDAAGHLKSAVVSAKTGGVHTRSEYDTDAQGRIKETRDYRGDGTLARRGVTVFGPADGEETFTEQDGSGRVLRRQTTVRRIVGNAEVTETNVGDGAVNRAVTRYDAQGRVIEETSFVNGVPSGRTVMQYAGPRLKSAVWYQAEWPRVIIVKKGEKEPPFVPTGPLRLSRRETVPVRKTDRYGNTTYAVTRAEEYLSGGRVRLSETATYHTYTYYAPSQAASVIVIDPGHGGADSGAVVNGVREKDWNLAFARRLRDALTKQGATVYLTRDSDAAVPLLERPKLARQKYADAFVSVHCGFSPSNASPSGASVYFHSGREADRRLAEQVAASLTPSVVKPDTTRFASGFGILRASAVPAVLIEFGQMNNPAEFVKLQDDVHLQHLADTLAAALRAADNMQAMSAPKWIKPLPGDATVELLAVSDKKAARWWTPDGTRLTETPCDRPDWEHGLIRGGDDEKLMRIFVLRVRGVADENVNAEWSIGPRQTDGKTHGSGVRPAFRAGKLVKGLFVVDGDIPERARHGSLSYGVTAPKWRTYAALPPRSGRVAGADGRIVALVLGKRSRNGIAAKPSETLVRASDLLADHDDTKDIIHPERRLAAVAKDGRNVVLKENGCQFNGYRVETDAILSGLPLRQVKEFRLQTRPRFQVEFEDIALQPK